MDDKKANLIVTIKSDFHKHLKENAAKKNMTLSYYVRAILKKYTGYKEKELV